MQRWVFVLLHLLFEGFQARRDARIRFLTAQLEVLRRKVDRSRIIVRPDDRANLLRIGAELGHDVRSILGIVTHQTYRRWLRELKDGRRPRAVGRPRISTIRRRLIIRFARENIGWGYRRILGELHKLHLPVGRSSIRRILHEAGIFPPPKGRRETGLETPWRKFIRLHLNTLVACDFLTKSIITPLGLHTAYCLFFMHLGSRRVYVCPATFHPNEQWMVQQARNVQMWLEDEKVEARFLLRDRDTKYAPRFDGCFRAAGVRIVRTPVQAPNANAYAEAWVGSLKRECLNYFLCFGQRHLDFILSEYARFYNRYRPHQGVNNRPLSYVPSSKPNSGRDKDTGPIHCQRFLGGLLRHYHCAAA
jgi:putative transposase